MRANRAVLFDVDGTLIDAIAGQRRIWHEWAERFELDPSVVYEAALRTRPVETVAELLPGRDPAPLVAVFDRLEDVEAEQGPLHGIDGAALLLSSLEPNMWALVTSNAERRVTARFRRRSAPPDRRGASVRLGCRATTSPAAVASSTAGRGRYRAARS